MRQLRGFAPWIVYGTVGAIADWRWAAVAALVLAVRIGRDARHAGAVDDLARATGWCFAGLTAVAMLAPASPVRHYTAPISLATFGVAALASIARGRPFTIAYAKRRVAPERWETPLFLRANVVISAVWAASFLATATAVIASTAAGVAAPLVAGVQAIGLLTPIVFTMVYRAHLRRLAEPGAPTLASA
jgi:hypothetical protein